MMRSENDAFWMKSPWGILRVEYAFGTLISLQFEENPSSTFNTAENWLSQAIERAMVGGKPFELPINPTGSLFQKRVWDAARKIPFGETITYRELAWKIGAPQAARAIGQALKHNPIALIIPCHRILPCAKTTVGGYRWGIDRKRQLIDYERTTRHFSAQ
jgi:O-6-methylguanine DNA methyltransferase